MANLTLRKNTNQPLTFVELDGNFEYFTGSHAVTGSITIKSNSSIPLILVGSLLNFPGTNSNQDALNYGLPTGSLYRSDDVLCIVHS